MYREALTGALMQVNFASSCLALMCIGRLEVRRAPLQLFVVLISFGSAPACEVQRRSKLLANYRLRAAVTWPWLGRHRRDYSYFGKLRQIPAILNFRQTPAKFRVLLSFVTEGAKVAQHKRLEPAKPFLKFLSAKARPCF